MEHNYEKWNFKELIDILIDEAVTATHDRLSYKEVDKIKEELIRRYDHKK